MGLGPTQPWLPLFPSREFSFLARGRRYGFRFGGRKVHHVSSGYQPCHEPVDLAKKANPCLRIEEHKQEQTTIWWSHDTLRSGFRTTRSEPRNRSTTSSQPVDLAKKANPCLRIEEHKEEKTRVCGGPPARDCLWTAARPSPRRAHTAAHSYCPSTAAPLQPPPPSSLPFPTPLPSTPHLLFNTPKTTRGMAITSALSFLSDRKRPIAIAVTLFVVLSSLFILFNPAPSPLQFYSSPSSHISSSETSIPVSSNASPPEAPTTLASNGPTESAAVLLLIPFPDRNRHRTLRPLPGTLRPTRPNQITARDSETAVEVSGERDGEGRGGGGGVVELCEVGKGVVAAYYIPCLDNVKAIKSLKSMRHMENWERHCPEPRARCLVPLPERYRRPVPSSPQSPLFAMPRRPPSTCRLLRRASSFFSIVGTPLGLQLHRRRGPAASSSCSSTAEAPLAASSRSSAAEALLVASSCSAELEPDPTLVQALFPTSRRRSRRARCPAAAVTHRRGGARRRGQRPAGASELRKKNGEEEGDDMWAPHCDDYAKCGTSGGSPACGCVHGFSPESPWDWALRDSPGGCARLLHRMPTRSSSKSSICPGVHGPRRHLPVLAAFAEHLEADLEAAVREAAELILDGDSLGKKEKGTKEEDDM
ncbi:hypothetical protein HU200_026001 [Digitaria exilis]|uniref:Methyltransferase n=1 Tax=Digitaria exilis TaxID=1010633 RepID=A0A835EUS7_9POAL|nr:hypothetical protein HU200_026001 [Digitaria exilis]